MKISFHGAARTVTGSKHLVHLHGNRKILLDCGMFQGLGQDTLILNSDWGFEPSEVSHVILSHAHIDHIGLLPKLVKDGYHGKIFCTPATATLAKILLIDSAFIQEADVRYVNKKRAREHRPLVEALYTADDAAAVFPLFEAVPYGEPVNIEKDIELLYTDCGHIVGSAAVHLTVLEKGKATRISFSGDIGRYTDMILRAPDSFPQADYIIMESTYGDKLHEKISVAADQVRSLIEQTCIQQRGKLVMPAFSLGRTQEILFMLNRLALEGRLPACHYYVDSPLSIKITDAVKQYPTDLNEQVQALLKKDDDVFSFKGLTYIETLDDSKDLNGSADPCVIFSASGMAEAGRVKHHIANNISDGRNTILLTGYCEPRSLGGRLLTHPKEVTIFGKRFPVNARIEAVSSLSAHGDYEDMCRWLSCQDAERVRKLFLVHGEYEVQMEFRDRLRQKKFSEIVIPALHEEINL